MHTTCISVPVTLPLKVHLHRGLLYLQIYTFIYQLSLSSSSDIRDLAGTVG